MRAMKERIDLRLTPAAARMLRRVALARAAGDRAVALRLLIAEEDARLGTTRGETACVVPATKREA